MEAMDLEAKLGENGHGHKGSDLDPEKAAGQVLLGGDAKRPREADNGDHRSAMETDDEEEEELGPERCFELHRKSWLSMFGRNGAIPFEAEKIQWDQHFVVKKNGNNVHGLLELNGH
ncbi:hypothetical protein SETIT_7G285800v2 [Setaria italica]|uniref:Uncharacterized protein n=1 Tax=Setaria italica TaxID=4555 RepID=A0A368S106_SETIT|nr:hypothetical protein SETIT_7G285800v2 [Setaria italica]